METASIFNEGVNMEKRETSRAPVSLRIKDSHLKSVLKGITWRVVAFIDTSVLSLIFTHSIVTALKISVTELITKIFLFYVHERIWLRFAFGKVNGQDQKYKTLLKGVSWRIFGSLDTFVIAVLITHNYSTAFSIGFVEVFTKIGLFFIHERIWMKILWGRTTTEEEYNI